MHPYQRIKFKLFSDNNENSKYEIFLENINIDATQKVLEK